MSVVPIQSHPRFKRVSESYLPKRALAGALGYSVRWVELRMRDGMPFQRAANGQARYLLSEVEPWVAEWLERRSV